MNRRSFLIAPVVFMTFPAFAYIPDPISAWKAAYATRIAYRCPDDEPNDPGYHRFLKEAADAGWDWAVEYHGSVVAALAANPSEEADEEISCWSE